MPSIPTLLRAIGLGSLTQAPLQVNPSSSTASLLHSSLTSTHLADSCPIDGPLSCHNTTAIPAEDSCCFIYPSGQLLVTQFWDTRPSIGPSDHWTLHGLWPDLCDGRYESYCKDAPRYPNITDILVSHGETDLLNEMLQFWLPNSGTPEHFWAHEWNKHGTCVNTLSPSCYSSSSSSHSASELKRSDEGYSKGLEVVDYFARAVSEFKKLDTYAALADAGIYPSKSRTYTNKEISAALEKVTGKPVILGCERGALNQAWWTFNVRGSLQTGEFVPADAQASKGTCPRAGIRYYPKI